MCARNMAEKMTMLVPRQGSPVPKMQQPVWVTAPASPATCCMCHGTTGQPLHRQQSVGQRSAFTAVLQASAGLSQACRCLMQSTAVQFSSAALWPGEFACSLGPGSALVQAHSTLLSQAHSPCSYPWWPWSSQQHTLLPKAAHCCLLACCIDCPSYMCSVSIVRLQLTGVDAPYSFSDAPSSKMCPLLNLQLTSTYRWILPILPSGVYESVLGACSSALCPQS